MILYNYWITIKGIKDGVEEYATMRGESNWFPNEALADYNRKVAVANGYARWNKAFDEYRVVDSGVVSKEFPNKIEMNGYLSEKDLTFMVGNDWIEAKLLPLVGSKVRITIEGFPE